MVSFTFSKDQNFLKATWEGAMVNIEIFKNSKLVYKESMISSRFFGVQYQNYLKENYGEVKHVYLEK